MPETPCSEKRNENVGEFLLASVDAGFAAEAVKISAKPSARKRVPFFHFVSPANIHADDGTFITSRAGASVNISVTHPFNGLAAVSDDVRFPVQETGVPAAFTLDIESALGTDDIGVFSGTAVRGAGGTSSATADPNRGSGLMPVLPRFSADAGVSGVPLPAAATPDAGNPVSATVSGPGGVPGGIGADLAGNGAADPAETGSAHGPKRDLVLSASDMENIKTYRIGGETTSEVSFDGGAVSEKELCGNSRMAVVDSCRTAVEDYDFPGVVIGDYGPGEGRFGWIDVYPVMPGYSRIEPWGPGFIDIPFLPGEFDFAESFGIELTEGWVDFEGTDISMIELEYAAKLSLMVSATDKAAFTIYKSIPGEGGTSKLTAIQTSSLTPNSETGYCEVTTKGLLLEAGEYYISIESFGDSGSGSSYIVSVNDEDTEYFTEGDNSDDWTDMKTAGAEGKVGDIGILDECSYYVFSDWVGYGDAVDYAGFTLEAAAKLSFSIDSSDAAKFTIYRFVGDGNGPYSLKTLQTTVLSFDEDFENYEAVTKGLLLEAGAYYISVQSTNADRGGSAYYGVYLDWEETEFFSEGDNSDDWTDMKTAGAEGKVGDIGILDEGSYYVLSDWVGYGDAVDYAGFTLEAAAKLSFSIDSSDAAKFTIYRLVGDGNGLYSLKTLQTTALSFDEDFENYGAVTKGLLLEAGAYYISVQSTNADRGGNAYYDVYLDWEGTEFFSEGDNSDDWTDMKTAGAEGKVGDIGVLDEGSYYVLSDWVGYGDAVDYAGFTLEAAAKLSFSIDATDAAKFTICRLVRNGNGLYSLKTLQMTALSFDEDFEDYGAVTKELQLEAGTYYISVQSTNADRGGSAYYDVAVETYVPVSAAAAGPEEAGPLAFAETCAGSACDLSMPETDGFAVTDAPDLTDLLSFCREEDADLLGFAETCAGSACGLTMPETDCFAMTDAPDPANVLSFRRQDPDVLAGAPASLSFRSGR